MNKEDFFEVLGDMEDDIVKGAMEPVKARQTKSWSQLLTRPVAAVLMLVLLAGLCVTAYAVEMDRRYNAAVGYLQTLGIEAEDLSDYSRAQVRSAADWFQKSADRDIPAPEEIVGLVDKVNGAAAPTRPETPAAVTSDDIRALTPTMTLRDVTDRLGATVDVGSGICILLYEVDGEYTLMIPFAGLDAQLGVTGEALLEALQPIEKES